MEEQKLKEQFKQKELVRLLTPSGKQDLTVVAAPGETISSLVKRTIEPELQCYIVAFNHGMKIDDPDTFTLQESDSVLLTVVPQGGGGLLKTVLSVAVMVAAVAFAAPTGGASLWLAGATGLSAATAGMVIGMGISMIGMMAINALIPPPSMNTDNLGGGYNAKSESPTYSIGGQSNSARKYGAVTKIYGRHKYFPTLAANPLIVNLGHDSKISALYDFGIGALKVEELKIGDALASNYSPELKWHENVKTKTTEFLNRKVGYDQFSYVLKKDSELIIRTKPGTVSFDVDFTFNRGLGYQNNSGGIDGRTVTIKMEYRLVGSTTWTSIGSDKVFGASVSGDPVQVSGSSLKPFVAVAQVSGLPIGEYEIRVVKQSADITDAREVGDVGLTMIKSYQEGLICNLEHPHTMLEMRLLASEKLSGTVQNLNAICTSILRTTTDGSTFTAKATRNPAWIALDILTGDANFKPLEDGVIDFPSFIKFADFCEKHKYFADFVVDYKTTVQELLTSVLSVGHASLLLTTSGKYGILIDEEKHIPRQIITPANSWGFSGSRVFPDHPHAFIVSFINGWDTTHSRGDSPSVTWQKDERIVYADGYDETNATKFESLGTFGITDSDQAWRFGRYMLAQGIHRSETFSVTMDVEHIAVQRGDLVHVAHDVPKIGGMACRVISVVGNDVLVDTELGVSPNGYSVRLDDGTVRTGLVTSTLTSTSFTLDDATGIAEDDLIVFGQVDRIIGKFIVQSIIPQANLTAELQLVKYAPEVYTAETGTIPPWDPEIAVDMINSSDLKVIDLKALQQLIHIDRYPFVKIDLKWGISGFNYADSEIVLWVDGKPTSLGRSSLMTYEHLIEVLKNPLLMNKKLEFEVVPFNGSGVQGTSAKVDITPKPDDQIPADVSGFSVNVQDMLVEIFWDKHEDEDVDFFEVRYSPNVDGNWNASQLIGILPHNSMKTSAGARTGRYFIQAVDTSGNRSHIASQRTTIEKLPNTNQVKVVNDMPKAWPGTLSDFEKTPGGTVQSAGLIGHAAPESWYYFDDFVKFDDVYEVRVSSKIQAHGKHKDDVMARWVPLASANPLSRASSADWNAQLMVRSSNDATVMANWIPLASAKPIAALTNSWSKWRAVNVSDETAKVMQFAIKAESWNPNVKVVLDDGRVEIDASDWIWRSNDRTVPVAGLQVLFDPPFMDVPVVAITMEGSSLAEQYEMTNKNRHGFDLRLLDGTGKAVSGKVDIAALGQGRQRTKSI